MGPGGRPARAGRVTAMGRDAEARLLRLEHLLAPRAAPPSPRPAMRAWIRACFAEAHERWIPPFQAIAERVGISPRELKEWLVRRCA
jgi:hypothetical protein